MSTLISLERKNYGVGVAEDRERPLTDRCKVGVLTKTAGSASSSETSDPQDLEAIDSKSYRGQIIE